MFCPIPSYIAMPAPKASVASNASSVFSSKTLGSARKSWPKYYSPNCWHRTLSKVSVRHRPNIINILVACRRCRRFGEEIIEIERNSRSVFSKKTFHWLDNSTEPQPAGAPQKGGS